MTLIVVTPVERSLEDLRVRLIKNGSPPDKAKAFRDRLFTMLTHDFPAVLVSEVQVGIRVRRRGPKSIVRLGLHVKDVTKGSAEGTHELEKMSEVLSQYIDLHDLESVLLRADCWSMNSEGGEPFEEIFHEASRREGWHYCGCITVQPASL